MAIETEGRNLLKQWMDAEKSRSQGFLARTLDVTQPAVAAWVHGESRPTLPYREALWQLAGIPVEAWETEKERERRQRALEGVERLSSDLEETPA